MSKAETIHTTGAPGGAEIVKFPYSSSRRVHSKKPRRSKNGTPEERAAKAAAMQRPAGAVIALGDRTEGSVEKSDYLFVQFLRAFRVCLEDGFARGLTVDQIFDDIQNSYQQTDRALQGRHLKSETSDFPVNLTVLGRPVLNSNVEDI